MQGWEFVNFFGSFGNFNNGSNKVLLETIDVIINDSYLTPYKNE